MSGPTEPRDPAGPGHVIVMGVSGCGKSTLAAALARATGRAFLEADDLHPAANRALMTNGVPLTDADRLPWLRSVADRIAASETATVTACSALRRGYRDVLRTRVPGLWFVHLDGPVEILAARLAARADHFMPRALLESQLATLEPLDDDEPGVVVDLADAPEELVDHVSGLLAGLGSHHV